MKVLQIGIKSRLEQEFYNLKLKWTDIDGYTNQFHELALLCPRMVEPEQVKVEQYIRGLSKTIRGDVTSSRPAGIDEAVRMAYQLMGQIIQDKTNEVSEGEKRKGEGDRGGRVCPKCKNKKHGGDCWKCVKCRKLGHKTAACWSLDIKDVKVEQYIRGLSKNIRGDMTSSRPAGIDEVVRMAYLLMGQIIQDKTDEVSEGEKGKGIMPAGKGHKGTWGDRASA
nr:hypothetical protein [Tanacetum cinerariifolium]